MNVSVSEIFTSVEICSPPPNFSFKLSIINISMAVVRNDEVGATVALSGCFRSLELLLFRTFR